ncbi:MAG: VWA domain-containing protein, partial [Halobacteriovoraceae bacterium]|nr:VWA domain-containing protein [Halobacteriovoraceae bacterium]
PNRIEASKSKIIEFINLKPADRIGIIMFSERVFTLLPLSTDLDLIKDVVGEIRTGFLGSGTNIGDAIGLAVARAANSMAKSKVIILLTDGVSNVGSITPLVAARKAQEQKVKIYTIGVGGNKDAKIPLGKSIFGKTRYQNIPGGSIDMKTLKEISKITNAKSYIAKDSQSLKKVLLEINKLEKTKIDKKERIIYKELYHGYLVLGVTILLMVDLSRRFLLKEII